MVAAVAAGDEDEVQCASKWLLKEEKNGGAIDGAGRGERYNTPDGACLPGRGMQIQIPEDGEIDDDTDLQRCCGGKRFHVGYSLVVVM